MTRAVALIYLQLKLPPNSIASTSIRIDFQIACSPLTAKMQHTHFSYLCICICRHPCAHPYNSPMQLTSGKGRIQKQRTKRAAAPNKRAAHLHELLRQHHCSPARAPLSTPLLTCMSSSVIAALEPFGCTGGGGSPRRSASIAANAAAAAAADASTAPPSAAPFSATCPKWLATITLTDSHTARLGQKMRMLWPVNHASKSGNACLRSGFPLILHLLCRVN